MHFGLFAFAAACIFLGSALYINVAEQPARLRLGAGAMLQEWMRSNRNGFALLAALAVVSALLGLLEYTRLGDVRWLLGAAVILASWPYVYFVVVPVNVALFSVPQKVGAETKRALMREWGLAEWGQTIIGAIACGLFAWALAQPA